MCQGQQGCFKGFSKVCLKEANNILPVWKEWYLLGQPRKNSGLLWGCGKQSKINNKGLFMRTQHLMACQLVWKVKLSCTGQWANRTMEAIETLFLQTNPMTAIQFSIINLEDSVPENKVTRSAIFHL